MLLENKNNFPRVDLKKKRKKKKVRSHQRSRRFCQTTRMEIAPQNTHTRVGSNVFSLVKRSIIPHSYLLLVMSTCSMVYVISSRHLKILQRAKINLSAAVSVDGKCTSGRHLEWLINEARGLHSVDHGFPRKSKTWYEETLSCVDSESQWFSCKDFLGHT